MSAAPTDPLIRIALLRLQHTVDEVRAAVAHLHDPNLVAMLNDMESDLALTFLTFAPFTEEESALASGYRWRYLEAPTIAELQDRAMTWTKAVRDIGMLEVVHGWERANVETTDSGFRLRVQARH